MSRSACLPRLPLASLISLVGLLLLTGVAAAPRCAPVPQWHLDVDRAMDAIGLAPGMVVGEAGAGEGYFTLPMARRVGPSGAVLANDISARALQRLEQGGAREGLANIRAVLGSVDDPKFPRQDLQLVVVVHAFHDFAHPVEWLINLKKYLRAGARLAVIDLDPTQGGESHFWPRERISGYAEEAGYELVEARFDISDHLILVYRIRPAQGSRAPTCLW